MRTLILFGCFVAMVGLSAIGSVPADTGRAFAEIYDAFAPFGVLYRTYADHLFYGNDVTIPSGVSDVCERLGTLLGLLQIDLATQTGSYGVETMSQLVRFRSRLAGFCEIYGVWLTDIDAMGVPDIDRLKEASAAGLFSEIHDLQADLQTVFETALDVLPDPADQWSFGVAFSLRTLLMQEHWAILDEDLRNILYGSEDASSLPAFVDETLAVTIEALTEFIGVPLDREASSTARALAQTVYDTVLHRP